MGQEPPGAGDGAQDKGTLRGTLASTVYRPRGQETPGVSTDLVTDSVTSDTRVCPNYRKLSLTAPRKPIWTCLI